MWESFFSAQSLIAVFVCRRKGKNFSLIEKKVFFAIGKHFKKGKNIHTTGVSNYVPHVKKIFANISITILQQKLNTSDGSVMDSRSAIYRLSVIDQLSVIRFLSWIFCHGFSVIDFLQRFSAMIIDFFIIESHICVIAMLDMKMGKKILLCINYLNT